MPTAPPSLFIDTRRHQMFPILEVEEIKRMRRFGAVRFYRAGRALMAVGDSGPGSANGSDLR
jgi:thioredoxin reductase (NADPH)